MERFAKESTSDVVTPIHGSIRWLEVGSSPAFITTPSSRSRSQSDCFDISLRSDDGITSLSVRGRRTDRLPASSVFQSLEEASAFFQAGSLGYSATFDPLRFHGLELRCLNWRVEPLEVEEVCSSFFDDVRLFPKGSVEFDCALLMRGIEHEWHGKSDLCCAADVMN